MAKQKNNKVVTNEVRLSYANIWEPKSINGGAAKYSCSIIIPKSDTETVEAINKAIEVALNEGTSKFGGKIPPRGALKMPLRDGDTERDDAAYRGCWFVNANSTTPPQVVNEDMSFITNHSEIYSGVYAKVSITFYAFNSNGNRGVACGLGNIQKIRDGEPLGGRTSAVADFATLADDDFLS